MIPAKHKFHAKPARTADGFFASKAELARWRQLQLLEAAGAIRDLTRQVSFPLWTVNMAGQRVNVLIGARKAAYVADFAYHEDKRYVVEDVKGQDLAMGRLKRAIVKASLGIDVVIITRGKSNGTGQRKVLPGRRRTAVRRNGHRPDALGDRL